MTLLPERDSPFPPLDSRDFAADPMTQFADWYGSATRRGVLSPDVMALATASADAVPSVRMVLLKGADASGFRFFTHRRSRKGRELTENPRASLAFYWEDLGRQIRVEGRAEPIGDAESDAYFASRPEGSRFAAAASPQSEVIGDRSALTTAVEHLRARHPRGDVPRPAEWGGFLLRPEVVEFWQQGAHRMHDRLRYRRSSEGWVIERLAP